MRSARVRRAAALAGVIVFVSSLAACKRTRKTAEVESTEVVADNKMVDGAGAASGNQAKLQPTVAKTPGKK